MLLKKGKEIDKKKNPQPA